jgi:hypothetical protein
MARYINAHKNRGFLNKLNAEVIKNKKSVVIPEILKDFQNNLKPGGR